MPDGAGLVAGIVGGLVGAVLAHVLTWGREGRRARAHFIAEERERARARLMEIHEFLSRAKLAAMRNEPVGGDSEFWAMFPALDARLTAACVDRELYDRIQECWDACGSRAVLMHDLNTKFAELRKMIADRLRNMKDDVLRELGRDPFGVSEGSA